MIGASQNSNKRWTRLLVAGITIAFGFFWVVEARAQTTYTITAMAGPGGSISPSGTVEVEEGADQTFIISADPGYHVADVLIDGGSVGAVSSYTFYNVTQNHTIEALFEENVIEFVTSVDSLTVPEGGTGQFEVRLSAQPSGDVNVTVEWVSGDTDITVQSGAALTFTPANWNINQVVTLAAAEDVDIERGTATIRLSATGIPSKDITATEQDNDTLQFVTSVDTLSVPEGGTGQFEVRLSAQPSGDVNVTVAWVSGDTDITVQSGAALTFTPVNWNINQAVTLAAAEDVDIESGTATIRLSATGISSKDITATEQDNDTLQFVTSVDSLTVPEGGTGQFEVRLSAQPSGDVNVTVEWVSGDTDITVQSGAALTFTPANWNINQAVTLAAAEDVDIESGTATIRLSATGIPSKDVTATEQDNDTLQFVTTVDAVSVPEGGTGQFEVRLSAQPSGDVNVTVARVSGDTDITVQSGGALTFTPANWNIDQAVTLAAGEDVDIESGTATIRLSATGIPSKDVTATEQDNDTLQFVTSVDTLSVPEGGTGQFEVRLSAQPSGDVNVTVARVSGDTDIAVQSGAALTFTPANWNINQAVTLAAAEDVDIANGTATIRLSATGIPSKDVTATEQDNDTLQFVTSVDTLSVPEGGTAQFEVRLSAQPSGDVNVTVARVSGDTDITVQSGAALTFTPVNWNINQAVTLAAAEDVDIESGTATIRLSATGISSKDITATEQDNDTLQFVTSVDSMTVPEGGTAQFEVRLSAQPSGDVNVTVEWVSGDTDITVQSGSSLTFTPANWNIDQAVTLAAAEDVDIESGTATIRLSATGIPSKDVTATEQDNDTLQFVTSVDTLSVPEGGTGQFEVRLSAQPSGDVNVTVARVSGDTDITVQSGGALTFTPANWNIDQAVTLAAAEDVDIANGTATIRLSATGIPSKDVTATEQDNDTLQFVTSVDTLSVPEGGTANFQVRLSAQPSGDVNVTVARVSGDTDITVQSGSSLTFTPANWNIDQAVTLAAAEDVDIANGTATIRLSATGIPSKDITATEQDNDTLQFVTSVDSLTVPEGGTAQFEVRLSAQPSEDVNVTVARVSGDTDITVQSGAALTFTPANWNINQAVTLAAGEDVDIESGTATIRLSATGIPSKDVTATEQDNDTLQFVTTVDAVSVPEGGTAQFGVRLSAQPSGDVNVTVARVSGDTDITIQSGAALTFTPANWNIDQAVTLAAAEDVDIANGTATIRLSATGIPSKDVTATEQDNDTLQFVTSVDSMTVPEGGTAQFEVRLSAQPSGDVNVTVARVSGDTDITVQSGAALTFTPANWNINQAVTLAATEDVDIANGTATIRLSATGIPSKDVTATEQDNDTLQFVTSVDTLSVPEGGTANFQVRLSAQPSGDVNVTVARVSGDTDITVQSGSSLTFTPANWNINQAVTLAAAEDVDIANGTATIRLSATGVTSKNITATEQDDDADNGTITLILNPNQSTSGLFVDVAIQISGNPFALTAFGLDFYFDTVFFVYKTWSPGSLTSNWNLTIDTATPGRLRIRGTGGTTIPVSSSGTLINLRLQVKCLSYTVPTVSQVRADNYTDGLYDEFLPLPSTANFTFNPCSRLGDVSGDGNVTPGDAQKAFEIYLGILSPNACQQMTGDANCSQTITPGDAQQIFEHYLGLRNLPQCCTEMSTSSASAELAAQGSLLTLGEPWPSWQNRQDRRAQIRRPDRFPPDYEESRPEPPSRRKLYPLDTIARPGDLVNMPIIISNAHGIRRFGFNVNYPIDVLEYLGSQKTSLTQAFDYIFGHEEAPGLVRVEGESETSIKEKNPGALVVLIFRVKDGDDLSLPLLVFNPTGDIYAVDVGQGMFLRMRDLMDEARLIGFGNPVISRGNIVRVPIQVSSLFSLKAFGLDIRYTKEKLTFLGLFQPDEEGPYIALRGTEVEPGLIRVGGYRMGENLERGPGRLVELVFHLKENGGEISMAELVDDIALALISRGTLKLD